MQYIMFASIYETPEIMLTLHSHNFAAKERNTSGISFISAPSVAEATALYQNSKEYMEFSSQFHCTVYPYTVDQNGSPIRA